MLLCFQFAERYLKKAGFLFPDEAVAKKRVQIAEQILLNSGTTNIVYSGLSLCMFIPHIQVRRDLI